MKVVHVKVPARATQRAVLKKSFPKLLVRFAFLCFSEGLLREVWDGWKHVV